MSELAKAILFVVGAAFADSLVFGRGLGSEAALGASGHLGRSLRVGLATSAMLLVSVPLARLAQLYILAPLGAEYLTILVAALIGALVARALGGIAYFAPARGALYMGSLWLGAALAAIRAEYGVVYSLLYGLFGGVGFLAAALMLAAMRERLDLSDAPAAMKGLPLAILSLGLIAMAFAGLAGVAR
ncbi:MAG: hypothetical protein GX558_01830 [Clostridiales bacterium]|nr:hypothetical protein [Clostridiales bacterium]